MLFISMEDFYAQASGIPRLSREDEIRLAQRMAAGDKAARETLIRSRLPLVASHIQRWPQRIRTLSTVYTCVATLEKCVDRFNFLQDSEPFVHHLAWALRQCLTQCLVDHS